MDKIRDYCKQKRFLLLFLAVLFCFGIIVGLYLGISGISSLQQDITYYVTNLADHSYNYLFIHFFFLTISLVLSFFLIGIPLLCTILFYEGMSFGFLSALFALTYGVGGFFFALIFFIITKLLFVIIVWMFFLKCLEIGRKMIGKKLYKTDVSLALAKYLKACICLIAISSCYDFVLLLFGGKLISVFSFLL